MPQITISTDRYEQLARRDDALIITVEQLVSTALDRISAWLPGGRRP
jgi:hypothetical protein